MLSSGNEAFAVPYAPHGVAGSIRVPASKSLTQRALVAVAIAGGGATVRHALDAEDPRLLFDALREAGFRLEWEHDVITASGRDEVMQGAFFLGNNGTGVRFLVAQLAGLPGTWDIDGTPRLRERPLTPLAVALEQLGAAIEPAQDGAKRGAGLALPLRVHGRRLRGREVRLDPSASSQFVSALLLLGATLPGGLSIRLTALPPSRPYLDLTAEVLAAFGVAVDSHDSGELLTVRGALAPVAFSVEGDWSAAAFPLAAVAVAGGEVEIVGVRRNSRQGDAAVLEVLAAAGCTVRVSPHGVVVGGPATRPVAVDLRDTPDLFPALAVVAAKLGGTLTGLQGLAAKESDRLAVMAGHLGALGFRVERGEGWFSGAGSRPPVTAPGVLHPAGDHRVAMALAVAGCVVPGVRVGEPGCVAKSWPGFWNAWRALLRAGS